MRFHKNCRDRVPQLGPEASGRLRYAAYAYRVIL